MHSAVPKKMSKDGPRAVAVYVLIASSSLSSGEPSFLVVASRKHEGKYVFPKGGIEEGEGETTSYAKTLDTS